MSGNATKAWVVAADMGLGHQRAAYPLSDIAEGGILTAGSRGVAHDDEYALWNRVRHIYDFLSKARRVPLIGRGLYGLLHAAEDIPRLYPHRDLSGSTLGTRAIRRLVLKRGMGSTLLRRLSEKKLPLVTTFYVPALAADYLGYERDIYCVICDTDINRIWVADDPLESRIKYFAPCDGIVRRLEQYGVKEEHIYLTGFPLPKSNLGDPDKLDLLKTDMAQRIANLDPEKRFQSLHGSHLKDVFGRSFPIASSRPLSITFAIGGAGAQTEIAYAIMEGMKPRLLEGSMVLNVSVGVSELVAADIRRAAEEKGLGGAIGRSIHIIHDTDRSGYFEKFNETMRVTDMLWTKPSELSFYCGLGIPVIMAPCIGPHEYKNRKWLRSNHAGIPQEDPLYLLEWLDDWLKRGILAEAAWDGFLKCQHEGVFEIERILSGA